MPLRELAVALAVARSRDIDLVGPKGYVHGWIHVGAPGAGIKVRKSRYGTKSRRGIVRTPSVTRSKSKTPAVPGYTIGSTENHITVARRGQTPSYSIPKGPGAHHTAVAYAHGDAYGVAHARGDHARAAEHARAAAAAHRRAGNESAAQEFDVVAKTGRSAFYVDPNKPIVKAPPGDPKEVSKALAGLVPQYSVKKRGENHHVIKTQGGKSTTVAKYKTATEAHAHMAREKSRSQAGMQPSNARPDWAAELDAKARQDQANMQARPPAASGTKLVKGTRFDGTPQHDVHINGEKAGHVYAGESRTPVHAAGSRIAAGYKARKGYYAHVQRDSGGTDSIGHFKTKAEAVRAVESAHAARKPGIQNVRAPNNRQAPSAGRASSGNLSPEEAYVKRASTSELRAELASPRVSAANKALIQAELQRRANKK